MSIGWCSLLIAKFMSCRPPMRKKKGKLNNKMMKRKEISSQKKIKLMIDDSGDSGGTYAL